MFCVNESMSGQMRQTNQLNVYQLCTRARLQQIILCDTEIFSSLFSRPGYYQFKCILVAYYGTIAVFCIVKRRAQVVLVLRDNNKAIFIKLNCHESELHLDNVCVLVISKAIF